MANKQDFTSNIVSSASFVSQIKNNHIFNSIINSSASFVSIVDDFFQTNTWIANFKENVNINITNLSQIIHITANFNQVVNISRVLSQLTTRLQANISETNTIIATMKLRTKIENFNIAIQNTIRIVDTYLINLGILNINASTYNLSVTPLIAQYAMVSNYDSSLLSVLDSNLLSNMDYTII